MTLTACASEDLPTFAMPVRDVTNQAPRILSLWQGSWIAALAVGVLTWGLILWPVVFSPAQAQRHRPAAADALQPADRGLLHRRPAHHDRGVLLLHRARRGPHHARSRPTPTTRSRSPASSGRGSSPTTATAARTPRRPARRASPRRCTCPQGESVQFRLAVQRRHPLVLGAGVPVQDGRHPGPDEHLRDHAEEARHVTTAGAPSCAARTTPGCCSTSRS